VLYCGEHHDADAQTALSRLCPADPRHVLEADQRSACLPSCPSRARCCQRPASPNRLRRPPVYLFRVAQVGPSLCQPGHAGTGGSSAPWSPPQLTGELEKPLNRLVAQDPLEHGSIYSQWSCRELATVFASQTGVHLGRESVRCALKKTGKLLSSHRSPGAQPR